ncbi:MAG: glycosyltransferase [Marinilabiliaceae bacterium]|nr:glycosyltransferase [Marinilabiliaceae bacterium]
MTFFSFIIPVYNRPDELSELLESICNLQGTDFEVIVVEDGSTNLSEDICLKFRHQLSIQYIFQTNLGPGLARNKGAQSAAGDWLIFLDSDTILPTNYLSNLKKELETCDFDCFGGPDKAHQSFNAVQKAIGYSMTNILTTGGIRGGDEKMDKFYPRSYNLGVKKTVFLQLGGFSEMRFGEDLDFSMRLLENGYKTRLLKDVFLFHKRRNNFVSFFKQVFNSGIARINLGIRHPQTIKLVHWFPAFFVVGHFFIAVLSILYPILLILLSLAPIILFFDSLLYNKSLKISFLTVVASFVQIFGYGLGFLKAFILRKILKKREFHSFKKNFYK